MSNSAEQPASTNTEISLSINGPIPSSDTLPMLENQVIELLKSLIDPADPTIEAKVTFSKSEHNEGSIQIGS